MSLSLENYYEFIIGWIEIVKIGFYKFIARRQKSIIYIIYIQKRTKDFTRVRSIFVRLCQTNECEAFPVNFTNVKLMEKLYKRLHEREEIP